MDLNFAWRGEDRGVHVGIARVHGFDPLLDARFSHARHAQFPMKHSNARAAPLQPRQNLLLVHGLQFARRAGQQGEEAARIFNPQPRRRTARIFENLRAFRNHRLPHIHRRHLSAELPESAFDVTENRFVAVQLAAQKLRDGFARQVVFRGAQPARGDDQFDALQRLLECGAQIIAIVPDDRFAYHLDAELVQLFGQEKRVGVHAVRSQQFRTNRDDFRFHPFSYPINGKPRTSQSSVNKESVVARIARPEGWSAMPTMPEPLRTPWA